MIFSSTRSNWAPLRGMLFKTIDKWDHDKGSVFLYTELDRFGAQVELGDAYTKEQWEHLNTDPDSKLLIFYCGDYVNAYDLTQFNKDFETHNIDTNKVWFLAMDSISAKFVQDRLNIPKEQVSYFNHLLHKLQTPAYDETKAPVRFSSLSRNYREWRLDFYLRLLAKNLLGSMIYSFHNYMPYNLENHYVDKEQVIADARELGFRDSETEKWIKCMPYDIKGGSVSNKFHLVTQKAIMCSAINLCIESHFDPFIYWRELRGTDPDEFSPAFATEKIYKAIACSRPFIAVSTPGYLRGMREMGFKTFDGIIDESYDEIVDDSKRMDAIVAEVERLSKLSDAEFDSLVEAMKPAVKHNYDLVQQIKARNPFVDNWLWIKPYMKLEDGIIDKIIRLF